jgi:glycerophosphoryl diester phosphodiesterase
LYHDGVWEEKSTGKGSVAATTWKEAEKILLEDTRGKVSADRPTKLRDYLLTAKGKIYVEIDFKSSSKYEVVIKAIRAAEMADQVVLISYSAGQARKLSRLAPEMLISTTPEIALSKRRSTNNSYAAWLGYDLNNTTLMERLNNNDIPVLGRIREDWNRAAVAAADILITDYIFDHDPIIGLTKSKKDELEACLSRI